MAYPTREADWIILRCFGLMESIAIDGLDRLSHSRVVPILLSRAIDLSSPPALRSSATT